MKYSPASKLLKPVGAAWLALLGFLAVQAVAQAQDRYTSGHGDFGIEYEPGSSEFEPHWHLHEGAVVNGLAISGEAEYTDLPGLVAVTGAGDAVTGNLSNAGKGSAAWLGVPSGSLVYRLGNENFEPDLGFGMEELTESDWLDAEITVQLTNFSGPGNVAILSGTAPNFSIHASTFDPGSSASGDNSWQMGSSGHEHPVFYFSETGNYELTFTWTGTYIGEGSEIGGTAVSGTGTFGVAVVPEPSTYALLALGLGSLLLLHGRGKAVRKI